MLGRMTVKEMERYSPHVDKVLPGLVCRTEIHHSTFVDDANLVEVFVKGFSSLIKGDNGGQVEGVRRQAEGAHIL